ncbi:hypothetical protein [Burkholderia ubonensis]|nr:hypothetical protein [Burkholderia ubonensis]
MAPRGVRAFDAFDAFGAFGAFGAFDAFDAFDADPADEKKADRRPVGAMGPDRTRDEPEPRPDIRRICVRSRWGWIGAASIRGARAHGYVDVLSSSDNAWTGSRRNMCIQRTFNLEAKTFARLRLRRWFNCSILIDLSEGCFRMDCV